MDRAAREMKLLTITGEESHSEGERREQTALFSFQHSHPWSLYVICSTVWVVLVR